jgi:hypothetical protein
MRINADPAKRAVQREDGSTPYQRRTAGDRALGGLPKAVRYFGASGDHLNKVTLPALPETRAV